MIRLACASLSFDGFGDEDFVGTFAKVNDAGYRHLEFNCWYPRTLTPAQMRDLAARCREAGILVALENHVGNNLENLDDYRRIFDEVDSPSLGICMDTGHFEAAGVSLDELIDEFSSRINHIHLKENRGFGAKKPYEMFRGYERE
ncbi:MAG: sugar phosphate isomerase/epimerase family protein [bacterium]